MSTFNVSSSDYRHDPDPYGIHHLSACFHELKSVEHQVAVLRVAQVTEVPLQSLSNSLYETIAYVQQNGTQVLRDPRNKPLAVIMTPQQFDAYQALLEAFKLLTQETTP